MMVPHAFDFHPTDQEIINYLKKILMGEQLSEAMLIPKVDVYEKEPWLIFDNTLSKPFYFFTKLKKRGRSKTVRVAGSGTWKYGGCRIIKNDETKVIGYSRIFKFNIRENGLWAMNEFSLSYRFFKIDKEQTEDYAFCHIKIEDRTKLTQTSVAKPRQDVLRITEVKCLRQNDATDEAEMPNSQATISFNVNFRYEYIRVSLSPDSTIHDLKSFIHSLTNVSPQGQKLYFKGKYLEDTMTLTRAEVANGSELMVMASQGLQQGALRLNNDPLNSIPTQSSLQLSTYDSDHRRTGITLDLLSKIDEGSPSKYQKKLDSRVDSPAKFDKGADKY
ncbi:NAC domain-containing protein [Quillaja saponaria]|uniref:NAC domain-containing protein n=1 Tax=Quillaja saponaria TaxID=32244 RepID=A0AAD7LKH0_QUISA|nr:NAC domain-containing protein [Quillaja saponaria]